MMSLRNCLLLAVMIIAFMISAATPSSADIIAKGDHGFQIRITQPIKAPPQKVYDALSQVSKWWNADHTYSLDADNLYLEPKAHGWFGERLPGGGVVCHMQVVFVQPGKMIRLTGGLGPLQELGVQGAMTWSVKESDEGSEFVLTYNVVGFLPDGMQMFAGPVNGVLSQQVEGLKRLVENQQ